MARKQYVVIRDTKEKLEVIEYDAEYTIIKNTKKQIFRILSIHLISFAEYLANKPVKKHK